MQPIFIKLTLVATIWGGTFIAGRVAALEMPATTAALWRYIVASVALVAMVLVREGRLPRLDAGQWTRVALMSVAGVAGYNLCFMAGLETVQASRGSLIIALNPAATMLGAALFLHEPLTLPKVAGTMVALLGVAVELSGGNPLRLFDGGAGVGELLLFGAVLSWAIYTLIGKGLMGVSPLAITAYAALLGTALLAVAVAVRGELGVPQVSGKVWIALVYMGVAGTAIAFVWFLEGVQQLGPARAAIFVNLVPVAAIALGALLLHETITAAMLAGGALVVAGVWIINRPVAATPARACAHPH